MAIDPYALHTVTFTGGSPFRLQIPGNPPVKHDGGTTVAHLLLNNYTVGSIQAFMTDLPDTKVEIRAVEGQSEEQRAEREILLGIGQKDRVWPCAACPNCFWLDPLAPSGCGAKDWDTDIKASALEMVVAANDLAACPVRKPVQ